MTDRINLRVGLLSPRLARWLSFGYGSCLRCQTPWNWVRYHVTDYRLRSGCLPLCEKCWAELTPEQRLPFYRALIDAWYENDSDLREPSFDETWRAVEVAVLEGR